MPRIDVSMIDLQLADERVPNFHMVELHLFTLQRDRVNVFEVFVGVCVMRIYELGRRNASSEHCNCHPNM